MHWLTIRNNFLNGKRLSCDCEITFVEHAFQILSGTDENFALEKFHRKIIELSENARGLAAPQFDGIISLSRNTAGGILLTNRFQEQLWPSLKQISNSKTIPGLPWSPTSSLRLTALPSRCFQPRPGWAARRSRRRRGRGSCRCGTSPSRRTSSTRWGRGCSSTGGGRGEFYPKFPRVIFARERITNFHTHVMWI